MKRLIVQWAFRNIPEFVSRSLKTIGNETLTAKSLADYESVELLEVRELFQIFQKQGTNSGIFLDAHAKAFRFSL